MYFEIVNSVALERLYDYLDERFVPSYTREFLRSTLRFRKSSIYPLVIELSGINFYIPKDINQEIPMVTVRTKEVFITANGETRKLRDGLDIYPKFKRADWYSGKVAFEIKDFDSFTHFVGLFQTGKLKDLPDVYGGGTCYLTVKESDITYHKECPKDLPIVEYGEGYEFPSPLEVM